jgi:hypothetical protein
MATSRDTYLSPRTRGSVILSAAKDLSVKIHLAFSMHTYPRAEGRA